MPDPRFIPMPPSAPAAGAASAAAGSTSIAITFPDGQTAIISSSALVYGDPATNKILVGGSHGTPNYTYICQNAAEMILLTRLINDAIQSGIQTVGLPSVNPTPAVGDLAALSPATGTVMGGTLVVLTTTAKPVNGAAPTKSFTPSCVVLIGGRKCPYVQFVNAFTLFLITPPGTVTGNVSLDYTDLFGTIHVDSSVPAFAYT